MPESLKLMKYSSRKYFSDQLSTFHNALRLIDEELKKQEGYVNENRITKNSKDSSRASFVSIEEINISDQNSTDIGDQELVLLENITSANVDLASTSFLSDQSSLVTSKQYQTDENYQDLAYYNSLMNDRLFGIIETGIFDQITLFSNSKTFEIENTNLRLKNDTLGTEIVNLKSKNAMLQEAHSNLLSKYATLELKHVNLKLSHKELESQI
ncbi:9515_t:CDS:2 [Gigaspora margarita]|uniref:9515_t:CDS:1 n=1 Tax=Gigaspora margarita TaxID=4874 RepID=A0ABN7X215_GIGMA|nr:9515_t:CDS:2 [Gigaspora margarita]